MNRRTLTLIILLMILAACSPVVSESGEMPMAEGTPTTALPTPTVTVQSGERQVFVPPFTHIERDILIASILLHNGGCEYPCFWGITPGVSSWEETRNHFETFGTIQESEYTPSLYTAIFTDPYLVGNEFTFLFLTHNDKISYIGADTSMTVSEVLQQFGIPDEVQVAVPTSPEGMEADYLLVFLERGFMIRYEIGYIYHLPEIIPNEQGFSMRLCPRDFIPDYDTTHNYYYLIAWDQNSGQSFNDVYDQMAPILNSLAPVYHEIRMVSEIDLEQFFAIWLNETNECFILECPDCVNYFFQ